MQFTLPIGGAAGDQQIDLFPYPMRELIDIGKVP
jgi:hypothetical protein